MLKLLLISHNVSKTIIANLKSRLQIVFALGQLKGLNIVNNTTRAIASWCSSLKVFFWQMELYILYLIVEREGNIQLVLSVEHISHVKIST